MERCFVGVGNKAIALSDAKLYFLFLLPLPCLEAPELFLVLAVDFLLFHFFLSPPEPLPLSSCPLLFFFPVVVFFGDDDSCFFFGVVFDFGLSAGVFILLFFFVDGVSVPVAPLSRFLTV